MGWLKNTMNAITQKFVELLPDRGGKASTEDTALIIETSPTIWEYEMFRLEWDRRTTLREIDLMLRSDTRIKRANKVLAATAVRRGITVTVSSESSEAIAAQAQEVINNLMHDCQINAKLPSWARILPKEGDLFLNPIVDLKERKIKNIKRLPAITIQRNDDMTGNFTDTMKAFRQIDPISLQTLSEFPLWAVNHIRYDHEEGDRYGTSQYLACRGYWKKLDMTEQDLVVRRRTRAPQRRLHSIGDKDHPQQWTEVAKYKDENKLTPKTAQVTTDYYGNGLVDIKNLDGDAHLDEIKDVEHLQEVYMIGTAVPLHILGFGQNVNRDIVEDQKAQFEEDTQELRGLLENGDSSPYSGLRFIFDFALSLAGINPLLVEYNVRWFENDNESANDRVDRVVKLRSSQPDPLLSRKTALTVISKDIGLEGEDAVEAELQAIKVEMEEDRKEQEALKAALNPENSTTVPISRSTAAVSGKPTTDSQETSDDLPLYSKKVVKLGKKLADDIRKIYRSVYEAMEEDIGSAVTKAHDLRGVFGDDIEPDQKDTEHILELFDQVWEHKEDSLSNDFLTSYQTMAGVGRSVAAVNAGVRVTTDFINPNVLHYLQEQSGERAGKINLTTRKLLQQQLSEAYKNQESISQWTERIKSVLGVNLPIGRAEMIARTELAWAYSRGLLATYNEIGVHAVTWLAVLDNRTCPVCRDRNGNSYSLSEAEEMLPAHPRCRCTVVAANSGAEVKKDVIPYFASGDGLTINQQKQNRHIEGTKEYNQYVKKLAKDDFKPSILTADPQEVIDKYAGTGRQIISTKGVQPKEVITLPDIAGKYYNTDRGEYVETNNVTVVYSKTGSHVYPSD
ncbi:MAG: polymorphic toxin type 50 domain-containing protein [Desulfitobacteriaceae bacterium]